MTDKFISSVHIDKLGHKILEIRERALLNIISKLNNGVLFDNDLARCRELLNKLFKWFLFEPCTKEIEIIALLKRILQSESGRMLIKHYGSDLKEELTRIHSYIEPKYYALIDELFGLVDQQVERFIVPPLQCDVPLSYRSNTSEKNLNFIPSFGTTATTIKGHVQKESSVDQQVGPSKWSSQSSENYSFNDESTSNKLNTEYDNGKVNNLPNYILKWQPLVEPDRHVLQSVENSLKNPPQPSAYLHSCDFFVNVLLHDFPAEIFLQRPAIVLEFYSLITCGSTRIANSVLNCLVNLTSALKIRINHCDEASMINYKLQLLPQLNSASNTPVSRNSENDEVSSSISEKFERTDEILLLQKNQLSLPKYCFLSITNVLNYLCGKQDTVRENKVKINQAGFNLSLLLLEEILDLFCMTIQVNIWDQKQNEITLKVLKDFNEILIHYGDALDHFRLESVTLEGNIAFRVIYLYLIHNVTNILKRLVPISRCELILPRNLKNALSDSLFDVTLGRLYPEVHNMILEYAENFSKIGGADRLKKYRDVQRICAGMSATVKFLKSHQSLGTFECLKLAKEALPSLEFHKEYEFLRVFVEICAEKVSQLSGNERVLNIVEEVVLSLLSHNVMEIKEEMYKLCHKVIVANIGPKLNMSQSGLAESQILFLLTSKILTEVAVFGVTSKNSEIQHYAEDILIYILKCKILVSDSVWNRVIEALIPSLPIIACHASKETVLGKTVLTLMDPDAAKSINIPLIVMVKCNVQFLFANDAYLREEAFSRICWLLASQQNCRELLPKLNTLYDTSLANICHLKRVVDVNKVRCMDHFYQPSSLHQVMEVLNSQNVEPVLRRSALNQVSVMTEDPLLHQIFIESNGVEVVTHILESALTDQNYRDYPDSVIPIVSILKNLCLYHSNVREELSTNVEMFYFILRGLFFFFTEERLKQDATTLLFLLIFKDFVRGSPSKANLSLPDVVCEKMHLPFLCNSHMKISEYTMEDLRASIISDRWCMSSIQIQWNSDIFGGFQKLMKWDNINYDENSVFRLVDDLKLNEQDLKSLKSSSIDYCISKYLTVIQNGTSHSAVLESIDYLSLYVYFYKISCNFNAVEDSFLQHPWEASFSRFIKSLPSCEEDFLLLLSVIKFFIVLIPFYKDFEKDCWIISILKDSSQCLLDVLSVEYSTEENKVVGQELLKLITNCVCQEQHYLDFYISGITNKIKPWSNVIKIIADNLKFNNAQHFYNLAYLDSLLSCLVHLTATLGWSNPKQNSSPGDVIPQMISSLCELVRAFHCGKGPSAAVSVMGLSITRHALLILNHLIAELRHSDVKRWEMYFFDDIDSGKLLRSFLALWASRDVVLRAATLQLFGGLAVSPRAAMEIANEVKLDNGSIWELTFTVVIDHNEASIVRENAAQLLGNLAGHTVHVAANKAASMSALNKKNAQEILNLLEEYDFYKHLDIILNNLFTMHFADNTSAANKLNGMYPSDKSWSSSSGNTETNQTVVTTPGFIRTLGMFLYNVLNIFPEEMSATLYDQGLVKLLFRTMCNPSMSINNTKELALYCDILEMDAVICSVLARLASVNLACLGTILHLRDCLNLLLSLLNHKIYHVHLPQLLYLRNKLWIEIFRLIAIMIESTVSNEGQFTDRSIEVLSVFCDTLQELGSEAFIASLCESLSYIEYNELQNSALISLTSLLRIESYRIYENFNINCNNSLQTVLDSLKTPRSVIISDVEDNIENMPHKIRKKLSSNILKKSSSKHKMNLLEEAYFGKVFPGKVPEISENVEVNFVENGDDALMVGAEICKILLYLYDVCEIKANSDVSFNKKKASVLAALSSLLCISIEAKKYAIKKNLMHVVIKQLREVHIKLSLESVECLKRVADKKRVCPILKEINDLVGLLSNFMVHSETVKSVAATLNLADIIHKLWVWFSAQNNFLVDVLRMLCVYTTKCSLACQSMLLTSPIAGSGPRKTASIVSLLHTIIRLIGKEMDQISKTHNLTTLELSFSILQNCCECLECKVLISKSNLFQCVSRLHPAMTKRQRPWESIEHIWLEFLQVFTMYPEGQTCVAKISDVLELVVSLASSSREQNRLLAMMILRNLSFYQPNKPRLLSLGDFLYVLQTKLANGSLKEKNIVVLIMWALAANNQKGKIILKSAHLDTKLEDAIRHYQLFSNGDFSVESEDLDRMRFVLDLLRDGNKSR